MRESIKAEIVRVLIRSGKRITFAALLFLLVTVLTNGFQRLWGPSALERVYDGGIILFVVTFIATFVWLLHRPKTYPRERIWYKRWLSGFFRAPPRYGEEGYWHDLIGDVIIWLMLVSFMIPVARFAWFF